MATTTITNAPAGTNTQVRIQLSTRDSALEFPEKPGPILVSTTLRRYALSTLCNTLLDSPTPIPFEFLINGQFLRTSIDDFLTENGISAETTLNVEYIRAQLPPQHQASFEHDDWVSSVDVLSHTSPASVWAGSAGVEQGRERILSGSYDGLLRVWDNAGNIIATSSPIRDHTSTTQKILTTKWLSPNTLVSAGWSRATRLWNYTESGSSTTPTGTLTPTLDLYGHKLPVHSLAVHAPSSRILTASADCTAMLWSSSTSPSDSTSHPAPSNLLPAAFPGSAKRRKLSSSASESKESKVPTRGPITALVGHTGPVRSVLFHPTDPTVAYTASSDRTLRTWDLVTAACVSSRTPASHTPLASLCALPSLGLVAVGTTTSRSVLLIDPREGASGAGGGRAVVMRLRGHRNDVVTLAADPGNSWGLGSGSHDGTVRVWDVRNAGGGSGAGGAEEGTGAVDEKVGSATFRIPRRGNAKCDAVTGGEGWKVLGMCWDREVGIVSAGEDKMVQVDRSAEGANVQ